MLLLFVILCLAGCGLSPAYPLAGLSTQDAASGNQWHMAGIRTLGEGNLHRIVTGAGLGAPQALELAAGGSGTIEYSVDIDADPDVVAELRLQFLSTQGTGRYTLAAIDAAGRVVAQQDWVVTGPLSSEDGEAIWHDVRYQYNYQGDWIAAEYHPAELLTNELSSAAGKAAIYRLTVKAGQGQHVLITSCGFRHDIVRALVLVPVQKSVTAVLGDTIRIEADVQNRTNRVIRDAAITLLEPYGYGLTATGPVKKVTDLKPDETRRLSWDVTASRPHAVNLGQPWSAGFAVNGIAVQAGVEVAVTDPAPGRIFYVMTEDLEAIDSAGYNATWGNRSGWLEAEELTVQMAVKAEKLNAVAERYGAKWTHYIAWPLVKAAEWAGERSERGAWQQAVSRIRQSVRTETSKGHEYALHLHTDYDPYLPGNILSYNKETDGLWANHLRHGWSHSIGAEGSLDDPITRTGMLGSYQAILDELAAASDQGQIITARVGSFDFGNGRESEAMSIRAYRRVGLWASSDADGNEGGSTSGAYGEELYFTKPDDINTAARHLNAVGLVEFRPTPRPCITYDSQSAAEMNQLAEEGIRYFTSPDGSVQAGVHGIIGFTHAMFVMGEGDWQSTEGGQFAAINSHLQYIKPYADSGTITFGTASEMVRAYLDYYTPQPLALYGRRLASPLSGIAEYEIEIVGRHIPINREHRHHVALKIPLYLRDSAYEAVVLKNGKPITDTLQLPVPDNEIAFVVDERQAHYTLRVYHNKAVAWLIHFVRFGGAR